MSLALNKIQEWTVRHPLPCKNTNVTSLKARCVGLTHQQQIISNIKKIKKKHKLKRKFRVKY
jgi:hypothetical protein